MTPLGSRHPGRRHGGHDEEVYPGQERLQSQGHREPFQHGGPHRQCLYPRGYIYIYICVTCIHALSLYSYCMLVTALTLATVI